MANGVITSSRPSYFTEYKDHIYFIADAAGADYQLYRSDGTAANTVQVSPPGTSATNPLSFTSSFFIYNDALYFRAEYDGTGNELWQLTDTTPTNRITDIQNSSLQIFPNPNPGNFTLLSSGRIIDGTISVFDIAGKLIHEQAMEGNSVNIVLPSPAKGVYLLKLKSGDAVITKRITVE
jgi:ELWxxDGT repeat protein